MFALLAIPLALQVVLPAAFILVLAWRPAADKATWYAQVAAIGAWLAAIGLAGLWLVIPWTWQLILVGLFFPVTWHSARGLRDKRTWPGSPGRRGAMVGWSVVTLAGISISCLALLARRPPAPTLALTFPLRSGRYVVANGGSREIVNAHLKTLRGERYRPWRGQSYGVDLVKSGPAGFRAGGVLPRQVTEYAIYGDSVFAPVSGRIVATQDTVQDNVPPAVNRASMLGNFVLIESDSVWILLAHLRPGSVVVRDGEWVTQGQLVGAVGNTGNSDEPHLHLHAQRPGSILEPAGGEPIPIRLRGRYLVRNEWITSRSSYSTLKR